MRPPPALRSPSALAELWLWGHSALPTSLLALVRKAQLVELHYLPGLDHLGLSCVFDEGLHSLLALAMERAVTVAIPSGLPISIQSVAPRAAGTPQHPHRNRRAAMEPGQIRLCLSPGAWRGASCARASICAYLACNILTDPRATLRTKPDSRRCWNNWPLDTNH